MENKFIAHPGMTAAGSARNPGIPSPAAAIGNALAPSIPIRHGKLLHKLLVVFLSLSLFPLIIAGLQMIHIGVNYIEKESRDAKVGIAQKVAGNVVNYMDNVKNTLTVIHKSGDFLTMDPRRQTEILENVMNAYPMFMRLAVINLSGKETASVNRLRDASGSTASPEDAFALQSIQTTGSYVGPVARSAEGYPEMMIGVPIERIPGRPLGALIGVVNLLDLSSSLGLQSLRIGENGYVYVVDTKHQILIAHPSPEMLLSQSTPAEVMAASLAPVDNNYGAIEFADQAKHRFVAAFAAVPHTDWRVFVQQPREEAYEVSQQMHSEFSKVLILVVLLTLALALGISHLIVKRVRTLQHAMEQVGEGNFDVPKVPTSNDEFGLLTEKFIWMAHSLKDKTLRLISAQRELQRWNTELEHRVQERTHALQEAQEQLIAQEKLAALGQMASVVGHELRNPLAVMNNSVYFIKTKLLGLSPDSSMDPKLEKHIHILEGEIVKSNTIIRDILDFARNRALNAAVHRLDELVEKAIERITLPPNVSLKKELTLNGMEALVDEDEIRQVLVNLMENACQAMTSGGTLSVGTKAHANALEITIGDTGCGIPQEHLNKIFAPFFTTKSRGTGLGLAVVKKIIERHHGTIDVESKVAEGTVFHVRLPLKPKEETAGVRS